MITVSRGSYNDLGRVNKPLGWNATSKMCYERGCVCHGCSCSSLESVGKCQVKAAVLESVRLFGAPFERVKVVMGE